MPTTPPPAHPSGAIRVCSGCGRPVGRCEWCKEDFYPNRASTAKFCSVRCRVAHHRAVHANDPEPEQATEAEAIDKRWL